eukprot:TRINITY_DN350_c0_g3_i1.p1 TRINITY_DN350_c0_g3~~TRINITY_DN350_c0_g3_i1.p1  ORF type:complete len:1032 (+),score=94.91 TRINITY_DN350_c0_g3_i1:72-3098(+)
MSAKALACRRASILLVLAQLCGWGCAVLTTKSDCGSTSQINPGGDANVCVLQQATATDPQPPLALTYIEYGVEDGGGMAACGRAAPDQVTLTTTLTGVGVEVVKTTSWSSTGIELKTPGVGMGIPISLGPDPPGVDPDSLVLAYYTNPVSSITVAVRNEDRGDADCEARIQNPILYLCTLGQAGQFCDQCDAGYESLPSCNQCSAGWKGNPVSGVRCTKCGAADCSGRGVATSGVGQAACTCDCDFGWSGPSCGVCPAGYELPNCDTCSAGWKGDPRAAIEIPCTECTAADCNGRGVATSPLGATSCGCTCDVGYDPAAACATCTSGYALEPNANECISTTCDIGVHCNNRADHVVFNFTTFRCHCDCKVGWTGADCNTCALGFTGPLCNTCANGYMGASCNTCSNAFIKNPNTHECVLFACDINRDCSGNADHVIYNFTTERCVCDCSTGYTGERCDTCAVGFTGANCASCSAGYTGADCAVCAGGYLRNGAMCVAPACDNARDCNGRADHVSFNFTASQCQCDCARGYGGEDCNECSRGYTGATPPFLGGVCDQCDRDYLRDQSGLCVPAACDSFVSCGGNAAEVQFNTTTGMCQCVCSRGFAGATCNVCAVGYSGRGCDVCSNGYVQAASGACLEPTCDIARDCSSNAAHVSFNYTTYACECDCVRRFTGATCNRCATGWVGEGCSACATGYTGGSCDVCVSGYTKAANGDCVAPRTCSVQADCTGNANFVEFNFATQSCSCECKVGFEGGRCERCTTGHTARYCDVCVEGYVKDTNGRCVVASCSAVNDCSSNADAVYFNAETKTCDCNCKSGYTGEKCSARVCSPGFAGDRCDQCATGYEGSSCDVCAPGFTTSPRGCVSAAGGNVDNDDDDLETGWIVLIVLLGVCCLILLAVLLASQLNKSQQRRAADETIRMHETTSHMNKTMDDTHYSNQTPNPGVMVYTGSNHTYQDPLAPPTSPYGGRSGGHSPVIYTQSYLRSTPDNVSPPRRKNSRKNPTEITML